ncbi:MAG: twin-arginine translocation signal domain-containing protein, partial [Saprospiraceae bacterium]
MNRRHFLKNSALAGGVLSV